jgi:hypothetical protein
MKGIVRFPQGIPLEGVPHHAKNLPASAAFTVSETLKISMGRT